MFGMEMVDQEGEVQLILIISYIITHVQSISKADLSLSSGPSWHNNHASWQSMN